MGPDHLEEMLAAPRGFVVAAAGCGKTELLGKLVADPRSGRQLVLTHTHAGVAALKRRFERMRVAPAKYEVATLDGWGLRYGAAYPKISGMQRDAETEPDWALVAPGACEVVSSELGRAVVQASYDGVLVDEYQDCRASQHRLVQALGALLPCRAVGDPLQTVFNFRDEKCVSLAEIEAEFDRQSDLSVPWRWRRTGCNEELGAWLVEARAEMEKHGQLTIADDAPVHWVEGSGYEVEARACDERYVRGETHAVLLQWPDQCIRLAQRLGGRWPVVEKFDDPALPELAQQIASGPGTSTVRAVYQFVRDRVTHVGGELGSMVDAIAKGRSTRAFRNHLDHRDRLAAIAERPSPEVIEEAIEAIVRHDKWVLYRPENVHQLRSGLRECRGLGVDAVPEAVAVARVRARHRGRRTYLRTIGTPLLLKGLEFQHAIVCRPESLGINGLYVAITRGAKSLTLVSKSRVIVPVQS